MLCRTIIRNVSSSGLGAGRRVGRETGRARTHTFRMWMDSDRDEDGEDNYDATSHLGAVRDPNAYWRRRFFILGGGIVVVGLCVWLFPGAHRAAPRASAAAKASTAALDRRGVLPAAAYGKPWPSPTPKPTATPAATKSPVTSADPRRTATRAYPVVSPSPTSSASVKGPRCVPSDIVLSLFTGQPSYGQGTPPKFDVYAVSTASAACTLSYGPGSVQVVVTKSGRVVWDSAACKPRAAAPVRFTLGVPQVLSIAWNRRASAPAGCAGTLPAGPWGTFDAVAMTDGQSSPVRSFTLSR
jgi:hypothetical protein